MPSLRPRRNARTRQVACSVWDLDRAATEHFAARRSVMGNTHCWHRIIWRCRLEFSIISLWTAPRTHLPQVIIKVDFGNRDAVVRSFWCPDQVTDDRLRLRDAYRCPCIITDWQCGSSKLRNAQQFAPDSRSPDSRSSQFRAMPI